MQIDENKRPRSALKTYFAKNAIPTEAQFAQLIDSTINQRDDGLAKAPGDPLSVEAAGEDTGHKRALNFYMSFADVAPAWTISLRPRKNPADANSARPGWSVGDAVGNSRLCIDAATGNVGIGTVAPADKLEVAGRIRAGTATIGQWPANANYSFFGSNALDQSNQQNYALLQSNAGPDVGVTFLNSPSIVRVRIDNADRLTVERSGTTVEGSLKIAGSDLYFTQTDHNHTGIGNAPGFAAIENGASHGALMLLGRSMAAPGQPHNRVIKAWDYLEVNGKFNVNGNSELNGKHAFRGNDQWLRLNQDGAFVGTHTPGLFAPSSINVGGRGGWETDPGRGSIAYTGRLSHLDVEPVFTATVRCADFTIGGVPGRRATPGRALVDLGDTLSLNHDGDWQNTRIAGNTVITRLVSPPAVTFSSAALKEDIRPMSSRAAATIVDQLKPVTYRWREGDEATHLGFIAEECPDEVATAEHDGIYISHIVAALTRVVRDQAETIAALERRLAAIEPLSA